MRNALMTLVSELEGQNLRDGAELGRRLAAELDAGRATPGTTLEFLMALDEAADRGAHFSADALDALGGLTGQ